VRLDRRALLRLAAGAAAVPTPSWIARAQDFPSRPVRIIVGYSPGGTLDIAARLIGQSLSERLGQQFVIENRGGAGGTLGAEAVVRAPPDGYTLLLCSSGDVVNAIIYDKLSFNFIRDVVPVASIEIVERLNKEINAALADPSTKARLADLGVVPLPMASADFSNLIGNETEKWGKVIRAANIKAE
jgi:tripartite-type tricarboxylate transporter receptor subunit TctC